jgi:thioredoxin reductase (NADPH)
MAIQSLKTEILIVGAGPAGLAAGIYSARAGKATLILEGRSLSRLGISYTIENYPGFPSIRSVDLLAKFRAQAEQFGARFVPGDAIAFGLDADPKYVTTKDAMIEARAVILATGKPLPKERLIPGEDRLIGQGVSYCATCDGPLFRSADVAAVGHSFEAVEEVLELDQMGCRVVWIPQKDRSALEGLGLERIEAKDLPVRWGAKVREITGDERVETIVVEKDGAVEEIPVAAVFVFREVPSGLLLGKAGLALDHGQCVKVDRFQRTSLPGVFAAGDVTCGGLQVVTAAGEGSMAALQALMHLRK